MGNVYRRGLGRSWASCGRAGGFLRAGMGQTGGRRGQGGGRTRPGSCGAGWPGTESGGRRPAQGYVVYGSSCGQWRTCQHRQVVAGSSVERHSPSTEMEAQLPRSSASLLEDSLNHAEECVCQPCQCISFSWWRAVCQRMHGYIVSYSRALLA
jgi:hypothetical protein